MKNTFEFFFFVLFFLKSDENEDDTIEDDEDPDIRERKQAALRDSQIAEQKMEERRKFFEIKEEQKREDALRTEMELRKAQDQELQLVARLNADKSLLSEDLLKEEEKIAASLAKLLDQRYFNRFHLLLYYNNYDKN